MRTGVKVQEFSTYVHSEKTISSRAQWELQLVLMQKLQCMDLL